MGERAEMFLLVNSNGDFGDSIFILPKAVCMLILFIEFSSHKMIVVL